MLRLAGQRLHHFSATKIFASLTTMNIDAYLSRIGYTGNREPTLATLGQITFAHATTIPFENLSVLRGEEVSLHAEDIEAKLVKHKRGGYCFEQNALLADALSSIGFVVHQHSARVWYNVPEGLVPPRTHMFLSVSLDGVRWLVDCGLGGSTPTGPMLLDRFDLPQDLPFEQRRIVRVDGTLVPTYMHQVDFDGRWMNVYEYTGETMPKIDQEMGNWWTSTQPNSRFRRNLIVAILGRDGTRMSLVNRDFTHRRGSNILERFEIQSPQQIAMVLKERFGLELAIEKAVDFLFL
jgi:arylamine N-acetyltransferase